ncbi:MAG: AMP-dependent synthetase and ligase, partial [Frankiales bacterium]|nr:AMP-dependent synthetase and ligase [Frankiales bacterium]
MSTATTDLSFIDDRAPNVAVQFRDRVHSSPDGEAYRYPQADGEPWASLTWKETGDRVEKLAAGLLALGLETEQRVGIA